MLHAEWGHERVCEFSCEKGVRGEVMCSVSMCVCVLSSVRQLLPLAPSHELFLRLTSNGLLWFLSCSQMKQLSEHLNMKKNLR